METIEVKKYTDTEIWKPVVGYDMLYEVSDLGRVRGAIEKTELITGKKAGNIKRAQVNKSGYLVTLVWKNNHPQAVKVHRLIAEAFIPNPENKRTVNHINGIKTDNRLENLEWATHKENHKHARENGLYPIKTGEDSKSAKLINQDVIEIRILKENGIRTETIAKLFDIHINTVSLITSRKVWTHI